jgi:hypothetical protein
LIHIAGMAVCLYVSHRLARLVHRRQRVSKPTERFSSPPCIHRRTHSPEFPPGMEFNQVQERWNREGMETPLVERRDFGAGRPAEVPPVRRMLFSVPASTLPPSQLDKPPVNAAFGKAGWS